ncbi:Protein CBG18437 [Caenorhabditis briggsae]|uniref:PHD-type domain-containing protein n=2 Tax=Caenorhabditis briggsae TaxID=6238 RepID=A0AAE9DHT6_CAEBR|nr:Protein CBG18437 [Caenorhabditis briggsae]ULU03943.1 hypothetical protein L3Y34_017024 [Caenorhabditis briggsae]CAP35889.1 Protein CBG18437 [Caenorhabditis briggsae]
MTERRSDRIASKPTNEAVEIIRCPCKSTEEGDDVMIECEECKTWQHAKCMGIRSDVAADTRNYRCEECEPSRQTPKRVQKRTSRGASGDAKAPTPRNHFAPFATDFSAILEFLAAKTEQIQSPLVMTKAMAEFKALKNHHRQARDLSISFRNKLAPILHTFEDFDDETIVRIIFGTSSPVDSAFLEKLKTSAEIELDTLHRITHYKSATLELRGRHTSRGKHHNRRRRAIRRPTTPPESSADDSEEDDSLEDVTPVEKRQALMPSEGIVKTEIQDAGFYSNHNVSAYQNSMTTSSSDISNFGNFGFPNPMIPVGAPIQGSAEFMHAMTSFVNSVAGMMNAQTEFVRSAIEQQRPNVSPTTSGVIPPSPKSSSSEFSSSPRPLSSLFLKFIRTCIHHLPNASQNALLHSVNRKIDAYKGLQPSGDSEDVKIQMIKIKTALQLIYSLLTSSSGTSEGVPSVVKTKNFMTIMDQFISEDCHVDSELIDLQTRIRRAESREISVKMVQNALESALGIVVPMEMMPEGKIDF